MHSRTPIGYIRIASNVILRHPSRTALTALAVAHGLKAAAARGHLRIAGYSAGSQAAVACPAFRTSLRTLAHTAWGFPLGFRTPCPRAQSLHARKRCALPSASACRTRSGLHGTGHGRPTLPVNR